MCGVPVGIAGSHWERRLMKDDVMSPISSGVAARISPMTLAFFEDSGWYTPNYTAATRYSTGTPKTEMHTHIYTLYMNK